MSPSVVVERHGIVLPMDRIAELCRRMDVEELAIFGSYLREDFRPESDIDFLAVFRNDDPGPWMSKLQQFERELGEILGRKVGAGGPSSAGLRRGPKTNVFRHGEHRTW